MDSEPKRVTRARAAIKATKPGGLRPAPSITNNNTNITTATTRTTASSSSSSSSSTSTSSTSTKIVTAAAKARSAPVSNFMAGTRSTAAKRKTRADEKDDEELQRREMMSKRPRGGGGSGSGSGMSAAVAQQKESASAAPAARRMVSSTKAKPAAKRPVGRPPLTTSSAGAARPARGRPPKVATMAQEGKSASSALAASTSSRARFSASTSSTTTTAAAATARAKASTTASKPPVKKAVTFREPDKENVNPPQTSKEPATAGLRGRPAKRGGAVVAATNSRASTKATTTTTTSTTKTKTTAGKDTKKQLNPTSPAACFSLWEGSDNEPSQTPIKPMMKSPIKPPTAKKTDATDTETKPNQEAEAEASTAMFNPLDVNTVLLGSPIRPPRSPLRDTVKSPAKRIGTLNLPASALKRATTNEQPAPSPVKINLLQSAAKRPHSAIKGLNFHFGQDSQVGETPSKIALFGSPAKRAVPGFKTIMEPLSEGVSSLTEVPALDPKALGLMATSSKKPSERLLLENEMSEGMDEDDVFTGPIEAPRFSRRSPGVVSKSASPIFEKEEAVEADISVNLVHSEEMEKDQSMVDEAETEAEDEKGDEREGGAKDEEKVDDDEAMNEDEAGDPMAVEEVAEIAEEAKDAEDAEGIEDAEVAPVTEEENEMPPSSSTESTPERENANMQLRDKDQDPCHDMSMMTDLEDDDDTLRFDMITSTPKMTGQHARSAGIASCVSKSGRRSTLGFTPLANQLNTWTAASPVKAPLSTRRVKFATPEKDDTKPIAEDVDSPMGGTVEDEEDATPSQGTPVSDKLYFDDEIIFTEEDLALFREAEEMSVLGPNGNGAMDAQRSFDDALSDASQEYGDENVSHGPNLPIAETPAAATPARSPTKALSTTTKVPLKPADYSSPSPRKRIVSAPPATTPRTRSKLSKVTNAASPSPSCSKSAASSGKSRRVSRGAPREDEENAAPRTPTVKGKSKMLVETPGRTPRKDLNPSLLRGAVVFVDAHTEEGADANGLFHELLSQMGARFVKSWNWTPGSPSNKVGITHVVFKNGSKRTLEKVREANRVVQCVGVNWVLDCEKYNEWVDEASYRIDTSNVPRGGGRRRKSMEPTTLSSSSSKGSSFRSSRGSGRGSPDALNTPTRRQSHVWEFRPMEPDEEVEGEEQDEESTMLLTPVPKTPAPEAVARFAADLSSDEEDDGEGEEGDEVSPLQGMTRTCPPKQRFRNAGGGILTRTTQDDEMAVQLMAARRRSLQFAPKIGSPLSKMWR